MNPQAVQMLLGVVRDLVLLIVCAWGVQQKVLPSDMLSGTIGAIVGSRATARGAQLGGGTMPPPSGGGEMPGGPYRAPPAARAPMMTGHERRSLAAFVEAIAVTAAVVGVALVLRAWHVPEILVTAVVAGMAFVMVDKGTIGHARGVASFKSIAMLAVVGSCTALGCAWWKSDASAPVKAEVAVDVERIVAMALEGKSIDEIARELGIDAAQVAQALLANAARVERTHAFAEAKARTIEVQP